MSGSLDKQKAGDATEAKQDIIDTVVDAIKAVTDNLPNSGALTGISTKTDKIPDNPSEIYERQADATLNQDNPTDGNPYTVLATTANVKILSIGVKQIHSVTPTNLQIHVTIDGQTITFEKTSPTSNWWYECIRCVDKANTAQELGDSDNVEYYMAYLMEGRSVKVEAEVNGGTVSNLACYVKYAKY